MKANRFIKYLRLTVALCLCIAMILPVLSCAETGPAEDSTQPAATVQTLPPEDTVPEETEYQYPFLEVDYGNEEFVIFNSEQKYYMIMNVLAEEVNGESVNDAKYNAMLKVEEKYKIDLT
ncbi:MAG: hypothetical protein IJY97_01635 [Clostridia bacterium]|nr:hypothetical protein [Clostridia bacterium]